MKDPRAPTARELATGPCTGAEPNARRREARQRRLVAELLAAGSSVVVDNTSPAPEDRAPLIAAAREAGVPVRAVLEDTAPDLCRARNDVREGRDRVPLVGVLANRARFVPPTTAEGFERIDVVRGDDGTAPAPRPGPGTPGA